jgi:hypothetical protein
MSNGRRYLKMWVVDDEPLNSSHSTQKFEEPELHSNEQGTACAVGVDDRSKSRMEHKHLFLPAQMRSAFT